MLTFQRVTKADSYCNEAAAS